MIINFQQGIIAYPSVGTQQAFLTRTGSFVSLVTTGGVVDITFAHGTENYYFTEPTTVPNGWGPLNANTDYWLYWDLNPRTAVRTFGFTTVQPVYSQLKPTSAVEGMHWFDTLNKKMYVYASNGFREVIRVFAAKVNNSLFTPLGSGFPSKPFAGSQLGLTTPNVSAGRILVDALGMPVRRSDGTFFTTETDFFLNGSPINTLRLEASVLTATAQENLTKFQVVVFTDFGQIEHATYSDLQGGIVAMLLRDLTTGSVGEVCVQGVVSNTNWNWSTVGAPLWVDSTGALVEIDPHITFVLSYPTAKLPIARVLTANSIIFAQQFEKAAQTEGQSAGPASTSQLGLVQLATTPADPTAPIVVVTDDPRLSDARAPLQHTHLATSVFIAPTGTLTGTAQDAFIALELNKLSKSGGTMTGNLVLNADPATDLQASTKHYVDSTVASAIGGFSTADKLSLSGGTMTGNLILNADPVDLLGAVTKQYVDNADNTLSTSVTNKVSKSGDTMTGLLILSADPVDVLGAATKQYVDNHAGGGGLTITDAHNNVFVASGALSSVGPSAANNIGIGANAMPSVTANQNTAIGNNALHDVTTGGFNVAIGPSAGTGFTTGTQNVFIGVSAGNGAADMRNSVGIGDNALVGFGTVTGSAENVAIGTGALAFQGASSSNVAVGSGALGNVNSASNNVAIGARSGQNVASVNNITAVGYSAMAYSSYTNTTSIGANSDVTGANQVQLGDSNTTTYAFGAVQNRSDARDKADVVTTPLGLDFILNLTPRQFRWDYREDYIDYQVYDENGERIIKAISRPKNGSLKRTRFHQGLIAQEVKDVMDKMGVDFGGYQDHALSGGKDVKSIGYEEFIAPLIKAIQELEARVKELEGKLSQ